jgi:hypothetical protein
MWQKLKTCINTALKQLRTKYNEFADPLGATCGPSVEKVFHCTQTKNSAKTSHVLLHVTFIDHYRQMFGYSLRIRHDHFLPHIYPLNNRYNSTQYNTCSWLVLKISNRDIRTVIVENPIKTNYTSAGTSGESVIHYLFLWAVSWFCNWNPRPLSAVNQRGPHKRNTDINEILSCMKTIISRVGHVVRSGWVSCSSTAHTNPPSRTRAAMLLT